MREQGELHDRAIIITGACGDLGRAVVAAAWNEGARITAVDVDAEGLAQLAHQFDDGSERLHTFAASVTDETQVRSFVLAAHQHWGRLDGLFANAGIEGPVTPIESLELADFRRVLDVNVVGVLLCMKHAIPLLAPGSSIVNTASTAGLRGSAWVSPYVTSKHAVIGLTKTAALELASRGVRVNALCPGRIEGAMMRRLDEARNLDLDEQARIGDVPLGRYASPAEIADMAVFLLSDRSSYATGGAFVVDGGRTLR